MSDIHSEGVKDLLSVLRFTRDTHPAKTNRWFQWNDRILVVEKLARQKKPKVTAEMQITAYRYAGGSEGDIVSIAEAMAAWINHRLGEIPMGDTNNGGPAFPVRSDPQNQIAAHEGMTLRDYFAGQALAGWLASFGDNHSHPGESEIAALTTARHCYAMADAMLVARNIKEDQTDGS